MSQSSYDAVRSAVYQLTTAMQELILSMQRDAQRHQDMREMEKSHTEYELLRLPTRVLDSPLDPILQALQDRIKQHEPYEHFMVNSDLPTDRKARHQCLTKIKHIGMGTAAPVMMYSCTHRGSLENLHFMWSLPEYDLGDSGVVKQTEVLQSIKLQLPKFHSRLVKAAFKEHADKLHIKPMYARILFKLATEDASAPANAATGQVDERLLQFIDTEDPNIVLDLRSLRENPSAFDGFFDMAASVIEETAGTAVDDRRHSTVVHMAAAMSGGDLYRYVLALCNM